MKNTIISISKVLGLSVGFFAIVLIATPHQVRAFDFGQLIDPACFFACDNDEPNKKVVNNTYTNSNNVNSNINSPGGTVIAGDIGGSYYDNTPSYDYDRDYDNGPLQISCYPQPLSAREGQNVHWVANVYGGNGNYHYSWSGTNSLSGSGSSVTKRYSSEGYKNATVRVTSGSQTRSHNCDAAVYIDGDNDYDDDYHYPNYPTYNNYPLNVSCSVSPAFIQAGGTAVWIAYASGGNGNYHYSWNGTDGLSGSGQSMYYRYNNSGQKYGTVTVYSDGQRVTRNCSNAVTVGSVYQNPYPPVYNNDLNIGCYADPINPRINQPITWSVEVTGGQAPYTYSWSGSDGLTGTQSSVIKYYGTTGEKSAIVAVTSVDGRSSTRACSHTVTVRPAVSTARPVTQPPVSVPPPAPDTGLSAASLFSLQNVPWGWVAILVILILFATVMYLLFNREKI